jgi:hypothetical protein
MPKALAMSGLVVSILIILAMAIDLAFFRASVLMDISFFVCGAILAVLSFFTWKEHR